MNPEPTAALYTLSGATGEIFIMLLVSFVLGALLGRLLASEQHHTGERRVAIRTQALPAPSVIPMHGTVAHKEEQPAQARSAVQRDDLKVIEGIAPRIEELLNKHGIFTWVMLAKTPADRLMRILESGNGHFKMHNPKTWPDQAALAANHRWEELKEFQELLMSGKEA